MLVCIARILCAAGALTLCSARADADDLLVVGPSAQIARGNAFLGDFAVAGTTPNPSFAAAQIGAACWIGDRTGAIHRYDIASGTLEHAFDLPSAVDSMVAHGGDLLVCAGGTSTARVDVGTGAVIGSLASPLPVQAMCVVGDTLFACAASGEIHRGDAYTGPLAPFLTMPEPLNAIASDGTYLWATSAPKFHLLTIDLSIGALLSINSIGNTGEAITVHFDELLIGGRSGVIERRRAFNLAMIAGLHAGIPLGGLAVLKTPEPGSAYCFGVACPCGNDDAGGGCLNSTVVGARLQTSGTAGVAADDLRIVAYDMPSERAGLFATSSVQAQSPFADGILCIGSPIVRFAPSYTGSTGAFAIGPGLVAYAQTHFGAAGQITAGSTWNYQAWFRDADGPCGLGTNTSHAWSVTFTP